MEWDSPWGISFPGWHIECSAMATKYLGQPFDIHCGGIDHIPVHHTNEIAQSEAAEGKTLANYWLHGEFLLINNDKMAKSGENFITLQTIKDRGINPLAYRYFLLQAHYRKQLTFSWEALEAAQNGLNNLYTQMSSLGDAFKASPEINKELKEKFTEKINDDLNMPQALAVLQEVLKSDLHSNDKHATIMDFDRVLGLGLDQVKRHGKLAAEIPEKIKIIQKQRDEARANKNWSESDRLRQEIEDLGYDVEDTKDGTKVRQK
jgi:cysteinyl-tRNA synthetase